MRPKKLSIVMATYNRDVLLEKQLNAFFDQTLNKDDFEIIVVNDGSTDETFDVLYHWMRYLPNLVFVQQKNSGPAAARNQGVEIASGEIIAFTDDDCIVDTDWAEEILAAFTDSTVNVILGHTYTKKEQRTPLTHQIENKQWNPVVPTCNAAYRKEFFENLGGFDTSFPHPHNEDTDLAWRALELTEVKYCDEVRVYHPAVKVPFSKQLKRMRMLCSEFYLFNKNRQAYKKWRTSNPWKTIYKEVFLIHQLRNLKFHLGFYKQPWLMIQGVMLSIGWWIYLILLLPKFVRNSNLGRS